MCVGHFSLGGDGSAELEAYEVMQLKRDFADITFISQSFRDAET